MRVGLTAHPGRGPALRVARRVLDLLAGRDEVVLAEETKAGFEGTFPTEPLGSMQADAVIAVGGDGTFLWTLQRTALPLLPIHAGTVGFLAEVEGSHAGAVEAAIDALRNGEYFLEERLRLASEIGGQRLPDATNDVVLHTSQVAKMRQFEVSIDDRVAGTLRADGIVISTPTGSTSYALSTQGPIVDPTLEAIEITAIAPFLSTHRALLLDPWRTVSVRLQVPEKDGVVVVDGQSEFPLRAGERLRCYRSPRRSRFLRFGTSFVGRLGGRGILPFQEPAPAEPREGHAAVPAPA